MMMQICEKYECERNTKCYDDGADYMLFCTNRENEIDLHDGTLITRGGSGLTHIIYFGSSLTHVYDSFTNMCSRIAKEGCVDHLRYAHENGFWWNAQTCAIAAKFGNLGCLKYANENGCLWDKETMHNASNYGNLECLRYARENGCSIRDS